MRPTSLLLLRWWRWCAAAGCFPSRDRAHYRVLCAVPNPRAASGCVVLTATKSRCWPWRRGGAHPLLRWATWEALTLKVLKVPLKSSYFTRRTDFFF